MKSGVPGSIRRAVMRDGSYRCRSCGVTGFERRHRSRRGNVSFTFPTETDGLFLSIDHILPRSRGGGSCTENLQVLCTKCNSTKGTK